MTDQTLNWVHKLDQVAETARNFERTATDGERQNLIDAFGLLSCDRFAAKYQLKAMAAGQISLAGRFVADGSQACVVSLGPVPFQLDEEFVVTFIPEHSFEDDDPDVEHEALSLEDVEVFSGTELNVGSVLFDHFGAALDPYPRAPGTSFEDHVKANSDQDETTHPFAELLKLKGKT